MSTPCPPKSTSSAFSSASSRCLDLLMTFREGRALPTLPSNPRGKRAQHAVLMGRSHLCRTWNVGARDRTAFVRGAKQKLRGQVRPFVIHRRAQRLIEARRGRRSQFLHPGVFALHFFCPRLALVTGKGRWCTWFASGSGHLALSLTTGRIPWSELTSKIREDSMRVRNLGFLLRDGDT